MADDTDTRQGAWHVHHKVLCEWLTEPKENRIAYIKTEKPEHERELRLRLLRPMSAEACEALAEYEKVQGPALAEYEKVRGSALAEYEKVEGSAWAEYEKVEGSAWAEYEKVRGSAWAEYEKVKQEAMKPLEALHARECPDCPWDGKTIFAETE